MAGQLSTHFGTRFQGYFYNKQSSLLQEVKAVPSITYPNTDMRGDG